MQLDRVLQVLGVGEGRRDRHAAPSSPPGTPAESASVADERIVEELQQRATMSDRPKANESVLSVRTHERPSFLLSDFRPPSGGYGNPER